MNILKRVRAAGERLVNAGTTASQAPSIQPPPASGSRPVVRGRARPVIQHVWQEKHWLCRTGLLQGGIPCAEYSGFYQTAGGRKFQGAIIQTEHEIKPYVFNPPLDDIQTYTGHYYCFRPTSSNMFFVHTLEVPRSVDEAIVNIEEFFSDLEKRAGWPRQTTQGIVRVKARPMEKSNEAERLVR
jgi:hypothetical protein